MANQKHSSGKKLGRNLKKCGAYRDRNNRGKTAKARRILARGKRFALDPETAFLGWYISMDNKSARPAATARKKRHNRTVRA